MAVLTIFFSARWVATYLTGSEPTEIEETSKAALKATESVFVTFLLGDIPMMMEAVAIATVIVFSARYILAIRARGRRAEYISNGSDLQHLIPFGRGESIFDHEYVSTLPKVAFVLPVKFHGVKVASPKDNWKAQLGSMYSGQMEAIFAVEAKDDGAVPIIRELQEELKDTVTVKLAVAGLSGGSPEMNHSQKIHNMMAGLKMVSENVKYVLFADVGCRMHPGTLQALVYELETDQRCFVATGYPFDVPPPNATIWAWSLCQFRYMCMAEFLTNRSTFVWGGAMLLRKRDLDMNKYNILDHWGKGGYADDMSVQACAQDNHRIIATPLEAVFPNPIRADISMWDFWDFLHRQNWVLTTYQSIPNRIRHMALFLLYGCGSLALTLGVLTFISKCVLFACNIDLIPLHVFSFGTTVTLLVFFCVVVAIQYYHLTQVVALTNALSPRHKIDTKHMTYCILFFSNIIHFTFGTGCMIRNLWYNHIVWRGIKYRFKHGRVIEVIHGTS